MVKMPICINMDWDLYQELKQKCINENVSVSRKIRELVDTYLKGQ